LAGSWDLAFDPRAEGVRDNWMAGNWPDASSESVQVPALWNVTHPDADGVGFYRRIFSVPADWSGRPLRLHFGGVSYRAEVWVNGAYAGSHEGAYTPFDLDVTSWVRTGADNELVVRAAALSKTRDVDGMVLIQSPASKQSWYYTHGGVWGDVVLEALPPVSCGSVIIDADLRRELGLVELAVDNGMVESRRVDVTLEVVCQNGELVATQTSQVTVPPGRSHLTYSIPLPRPLCWSLENPHLYELRVRLDECDGLGDATSTRFGVREFTVHDGQFFLNGEPILIRGVLLQPNYPVTIVTPPSPEMMEREIRLTKEAGFNMIRTHIRPAPPGYLDLADEMGMLIYAESCLAWIKDSPRLLDHGRRELRAMIERDRNHPSVVVWGINNENRAANVIEGDALIRFTRALDPTRVIVDNSGGSMAIDQDFGWVDRATVAPSRSTQRQRIEDVHIYVGAPIPATVYEWMRTLGISDLPLDMAAQDFGSRAMMEEWNRELRSYQGHIFVSELGCGGMADLDEVVAGYDGQEELLDAREMRAFRDSLHQGFTARRLDSVFGSVRDLIQISQDAQAAGLTRQIEALLANRRVSGYIVTQLNDLAWEFHAGLLDHWRNPKRVYHAVKRLNRPHCVILRASNPVVACGQQMGVALTVVGRELFGGAEEVVLTIQGPAGPARVSRRAVPAGKGAIELGRIVVDTDQSRGEWQVTASLARDGVTLAESTEKVLALPMVDLDDLAGHVRFLGEAPAALAPRDGEPDSEAGVLLAARPAALTEREWDHLLDSVSEGQVAVIGPMHKRDALAQRMLQERGVDLRLDLGIGNWMGCFHWLRESELLKDLGSPGLAGEAFVDVLPWYVMGELGGEVLAGSLRNTQTRREAPAMLWYSDIEVLPLGRGTLICCQYRIFEQAHTNPVARTLTRNVLRLAQQCRRCPREGANL